jgi:hypothetical protein
MPRLSDSDLGPPSVLPFPAGTSPFRQKGNAYLGDARYLASCVPGGYDAAVAAIPDPSTRAFFRQTFRASEWYDAYPGTQLELAAARLRGLSFEQHRQQTGIWHAQATVRGIYAGLLRVVSNESVALWGPRISGIYFEFGRMETRAVGPKAVDGVRRGVPKELAQWLMYASIGFSTAALRIAGARNPRVLVDDVEPDGRDHGRELVKIGIRIRWE